MTLARWDPRERLQSLRQEFDRLFEDGLAFPSRFFREEGSLAPVDLVEDEQSITANVELPGIAREDIEITVSGNLLTIRGQHEAEEEKKDLNWHRREIRYGRVERIIDLPSAIDAEKAEATFKDGVLTVKLLKTEAVKPKTIQVTA